jgi:hypothetical protein
MAAVARLGLAAASPLQPRWAVEAFARAAAAGLAQVHLAHLGNAPDARQPGLWDRLDRWAFGAGPDPRAPVEIRGQSPISPEPLPEYDAIFALGEVDDAALYERSRTGVWRFWFDGDDEVVGSGLAVRRSPLAEPRIACESWSRRTAFSNARTREHVLARAASLVERALGELQAQGEAWLERLPVRPGATREAPPDAPGTLRRALGRGLEKALYAEQWFIRYRFEGDAAFRDLVPPPDRIWADPFPLERDGRYYIFFEELPFAAGKAHIAVLEVDRRGPRLPALKVLERDYHLSYPFLLEHEGALYLIPESAQNRSVEAWRCVRFPDRWRLEKALLEDVRCVDPTLHRDSNGWWLFVNRAPEGSRVFDDELHLYRSERFPGEWRPHPRNPVKCDARSARPAGRLFRRGETWLRPAQICVPRYGAGISLNRVTRLTDADYAEEEVERLRPEAPLLGLHTLNRAGALTVVDAFARRRRIWRTP